MDSKISTNSRSNAPRSRVSRKSFAHFSVAALSSFSLIISACALGPKKISPNPAQPNAQRAYHQATLSYKAGVNDKALSQLLVVTKNFADTDVADDAYMLMGKIYCSQNDYTNCYRAYISVIDSEFSSPQEGEARLGAAGALFRLGRFDEALNLTNKAAASGNITDEARLEIFNLRYQILQQTGDRIEALKTLVFLAEKSPTESLKSKYRIRATEIVESQLNSEQLEMISSDKAFGFLRPIALYKTGSLYFDQRDYSRAEKSFESLSSLAPDSDLTLNAQDFLRQISARRRVDPMVIGAVLPLSGKYSSVGYKTLRGLEFGLGIRGSNPSGFKLAVVDSAASPDLARRGVERLIVENSAIAIVGDIVSRSAEVVAQKSDELGVPNIGLSQKSGITDVGPNVFQSALTSSAQVKELVRVAMEEQGLRRFVIIYPNNGYGTEYLNLFWDEVLSRGGEIRGAQVYDPDEKDFRGVIRRLVGTYYIEDREQEYDANLKDWYAKQKVINSRTQAPDDLLTPIIDFDAIFIPDTTKALGQIASMLIFNDVTGPRLLGTNLWHATDLVKRGTKLIENSLFVDAEFSVTNKWQNSAFFNDYRKLYGEAPSLFEAQAFDVALTLRGIIASGARSRAAVKEALSSVTDSPGSLGSFSVNEHREFSRPMSVLTVSNGIVQVAIPSAESKSN